MKKKIIAILCVVMCVSMLSACGNNAFVELGKSLQSKEETTVNSGSSAVKYNSNDEKLRAYIKEALEARWALEADKTYGADAEKNKKWYQVRADAESSIIRAGEFDKAEFVDSNMDIIAENYLYALDLQDEALTYFDSDSDRYHALWESAYYQRAFIIMHLVEEYGFQVDSKYNSILDEMVSSGKEFEKANFIKNDSETNVRDTDETTKSDNDNNVRVNVGDTFEADGLRITVEGADFEYRTGNRFYDMIYDEGMRYVGVSFKVENISDSSHTSGYYDIDCYADNSPCESMSLLDQGNTSRISAGRQTSYTKYWEVPIDAKAIELEYGYYEGFKEKKVIIKLEEVKSSGSDEHPESSSRFIIPDSDTRVLTENDLTGLTGQELTYARNEIYARHGYSFKSSELREYFSKFDWYKENPSFNASDLSNVEMANANLIQNYQNKHGLEYSPK